MNIPITLIGFIMIFNQSGSEKLRDFFTKVLTLSFNNKHCIHYQSQDDNLHVIRSVMESNMAIIMNRSSECRPSGYIIDSNNITFIANSFLQMEYLPHRRVLIFYGGYANFQEHPFTKAIGFDALDIYTIEGVPDLSLNVEVMEMEVILKCLSRNRIIINWNGADAYELLTKDFVMNEWAPSYGTIKIGTFHVPPLISFDSSRGMYGGLETYILKEITKAWPIEIVPFPLNSWMVLVKQIQDNKINIATGGHWDSMFTAGFIDITFPYMQACGTFVVPKPGLLSPETYVFQPMLLSMWLLIILLIIIVTISLYLVASFYGIPTTAKRLYIFHVIQILCLNCVAQTPTQKGLQIIICFWLISSLLITTDYSAGYSALITVPIHRKPINTVKDIIEHNMLCYTTDPIIKATLSSSPFADKKQFGEHLIKPIRTVSNLPDDACSLANNILNKYIVTNRKNDKHLKVLSECVGDYGMIFPLNKNSPLKMIMDVRIMRFVEHGFIIVWFDFVMYQNYTNIKLMPDYFTNVLPEEVKASKAMNLLKLLGALYLLLGGFLLSIIVFALEIILDRRIVSQNERRF